MPALGHGLTCDCCAPTVAAQNLGEVYFTKSAAAAAKAGDYFRVKNLVTRNPAALHDDGCGGSSGYTPLIYASREGHADIVTLLLELGADPDAATRSGASTALHRAAYMGHSDVVQILLEAKAIPTLQDADGQTALHKAVQQGHTAVAATLLKACPELAAVQDKRKRFAADLALG